MVIHSWRIGGALDEKTFGARGRVVLDEMVHGHFGPIHTTKSFLFRSNCSLLDRIVFAALGIKSVIIANCSWYLQPGFKNYKCNNSNLIAVEYSTFRL